MKLDTQRILTDWRGEPVKHSPAEGENLAGKPWRLGEWLAQNLGQSHAVPQDKAVRVAALSIRLEFAEEAVTLGANDIDLVLQVIGKTQGMPPWIVGFLRYVLDPDSLAPDERADFDVAYGKKG